MVRSLCDGGVRATTPLSRAARPFSGGATAGVVAGAQREAAEGARDQRGHRAAGASGHAPRFALAGGRSCVVICSRSLTRAAASRAQVVHTVAPDGRAEAVAYDRLCVASGARPRQLPSGVSSSAAAHVLTLRDTDSLTQLLARLRRARRVLLLGNGGIALELACVALRSSHSRLSPAANCLTRTPDAVTRTGTRCARSRARRSSGPSGTAV
jgi:hypothetical protein